MNSEPKQQEGYDCMAAAFEVYNYLKATGKPVGYLVNFGCREKLEWKRFARTRKISVN